MPNKAISYTQVPVTGGDLLGVHYDRIATGLQATIIYEVKDSLGAVRATHRITQTLTLAQFPLSAAACIGAANTAEGT